MNASRTPGCYAPSYELVLNEYYYRRPMPIAWLLYHIASTRFGATSSPSPCATENSSASRFRRSARTTSGRIEDTVSGRRIVRRGHGRKTTRRSSRRPSQSCSRRARRPVPRHLPPPTSTASAGIETRSRRDDRDVGRLHLLSPRRGASGGRVFLWTLGSSEGQQRYWSCAPARPLRRISDVGTAFDGGAAASAMVAFL